MAVSVEAAAGVPAYVRRRVSEILEAERVSSLLPACVEVRTRVEGRVPAGVPLAAAHGNWLPGYFPRASSFGPFPPQAGACTTPRGIVRVVIECVERPSGGMSSYYGFEGLFVSLLVSIPQGCVWDARAERAT